MARRTHTVRSVTASQWAIQRGTGKLLVCCVGLIVGGLGTLPVLARDADRVLDLWPGIAPGETTKVTGAALPRRADENPPATRVGGITRPQLHLFEPPAERRNGTAVLIFPGGGYNYVVVDKEGSEAAEWLNRLGVTAFVVHYRTKTASPTDVPHWSRPLQDGQRAVSFVRQRAAELAIKPDHIGVLGFSAGGQAAALVTTRFAERSYPPADETDQISCRPDFSLLVYPWQLVDSKSGQLAEMLPISRQIPPMFLAHAHDDSATSLSSVLLYAALLRSGVSAELHIYDRGGHGYGMRPVKNSNVDTWTARAEDWLRLRQLIQPSP